MASSHFNHKEFMRRIGKANRGKKLTEAHKRKISNWNKSHNWKPPIGMGEKSSAWKGGIKISKDGYRLIYKPGHQMCRKDGYVLEHRFVYSEKVGRLLSRNEVIHHIDSNKLNNSPDNLELYESSGRHIIKNHAKRDFINGRFI